MATSQHDKRTLYGTSFGANHPGFVSYTLPNANATNILANNNTVTMGGRCANTSANAIFVVASKEPPYNVYGVPFGSDAGCGSVMSVDSTGTLVDVIQNYNYNTSSGVHGMAFSREGDLIYSADDNGNQIWTHAVNASTGELTLVATIAAPATGDNPRHVAVSSTGNYLYAILEEANELAQFWLDEKTGLPVYRNVSYPLVPPGKRKSLMFSSRSPHPDKAMPPGSSDSDYWSDEVAVSASGSYLWATSRGRSDDTPGYISAFALDPSSGAITSQLFLMETTTSGGTANSVAPSEFSDKYVALTDSSVGFVEIWKFSVPTLSNSTGSASVVARVALEDGGCCANAVWVS